MKCAFVSLLETILILCSATSAMAQVPWADLKAGYCAVFNRGSSGSSFLSARNPTLHGGCFDVVGNVTNSLGIVTDIGVNKLDERDAFGNLFTYMFEPRLSLNHGGRLTPFAQGLVGGARLRVTVIGCVSSIGCSTNFNGWAFAADVKMSQHIGLRLARVECLMTRLADTHQNNVRVGAGIIIRLGERSK